MELTRRSLLKFMGGAVAGAVLSPLPWKLVDDASIWTQNWSRIARAPRGPVTWRDTTCTLCPAGCGLRARLVGEAFVSAWSRPSHPAAGAACPLGFALAQMRYHPARVRGACARDPRNADAPWKMVDADAAVAEVGRTLAELRAAGRLDEVAVLDLRPDRALSRRYREFLERQGGGRYLVAPDAWQAAAAAFTALAGSSRLTPAPAPDRARAVLAFGTPLADDPRGLALAPRDGGSGRPFHIQVDATATPTAARADRWLPARPGSEVPLALAIAHVLVRDELSGDARALTNGGGGPEGSFAELVADFAPERVAGACGLAPADIRATAHELATRRPVLVLGVGDPGAGPLGLEEETAIWCLNLLLGGPGADAPLALRPSTASLFGEPDAAVEALQDVPDGSLELLLVDGSFPGAPLSPALLRRKLRGPGARIVALGPYTGGAAGASADLLLPTPAPGEWLDDVPTPALAPVSCYAWSPAVATAPDWAVHAADWLARLEAAAGLQRGDAGGSAHRTELEHRAAVLMAAGRGEVHDPRDGSTRPLSSLAGPAELVAVLERGGAWSAPAAAAVPDAAPRLPGRRSALALRWRALAAGRADALTAAGRPLVLLPGGGLAATGGGVAAPVLAKLGRESELLADTRTAAVNPRTARQLGLRAGSRAELASAAGARRVDIVHDASLPPGVVRVATGPDPLDLGEAPDADAAAGREPDMPALCGAAEHPVWRLAGATLKEVRRAHA
jgi:hypothetical protein